MGAKEEESKLMGANIEDTVNSPSPVIPSPIISNELEEIDRLIAQKMGELKSIRAEHSFVCACREKTNDQPWNYPMLLSVIATEMMNADSELTELKIKKYLYGSQKSIQDPIIGKIKAFIAQLEEKLEEAYNMDGRLKDTSYAKDKSPIIYSVQHTLREHYQGDDLNLWQKDLANKCFSLDEDLQKLEGYLKVVRELGAHIPKVIVNDIIVGYLGLNEPDDNPVKMSDLRSRCYKYK